MKNKLVFLFLLLTPLFYSGFFDMGELSQQQLWIVGAAAALFLGFSHYNRIFGYGLIYCVCHLAFFHRPGYTNTMVQIMAHAIVYDVTARYYRSENYRWAVLFVLIVNVVFACIQASWQDVYFHIYGQLPGIMTLPVYIGIYAAITGPVMCRLHPALLLITIACIVISRSSFSALAFVVSMAFYLWKTKAWPFNVGPDKVRGKVVAATAIFATILSLFGFIRFYDGPSGQFGRRLHIWKMAGSAIAANPWGGLGLGSYNSYIRFGEIRLGHDRRWFTFIPDKPEQVAAVDRIIEEIALKYYPPAKMNELYRTKSFDEAKMFFRDNAPYGDIYIWQHPHSEYLLLWLELGFPAIILVLWYIWDLFKRGFDWGSYRSGLKIAQDPELIPLFASMIAIVIIAFAHFPFCSPRISFLCVVILAMLDARLNPKKGD